MTEPRDPVVEGDLDAYVDDQLEVTRRIEVEAFLSAHPGDAARVMADLRARDELRVALAGQGGSGRPATGDAARRLQRGLAAGGMLERLRRMAAVFLLLGAGWLAHGVLGPASISPVVASTPTPAYVEDALRAHKTSTVRAAMASQPRVAAYDPAEIRTATGIVMPALPQDWRVRDVQIYPSQFGPSVEMSFETDDFGILSLFAVRPGSFDVVPPTDLEAGDAAASYFQVGEVAYALVARTDAEKLGRAAARLADSLY
ncbi:anti-sigma factor [Oleomonas cavernae]|uniref:Anti-sigma factor n=1 Tax=Oleomonas cavernae TaxID=2320859 RepID=A0A418WFX2_9PROT|nr:anti-sigma factor [Oleomonas cavernae]RJF88916.1 anti-sigma factor [Oleomonas cavernae]